MNHISGVGAFILQGRLTRAYPTSSQDGYRCGYLGFPFDVRCTIQGKKWERSATWSYKGTNDARLTTLYKATDIDNECLAAVKCITKIIQLKSNRTISWKIHHATYVHEGSTLCIQSRDNYRSRKAEKSNSENEKKKLLITMLIMQCEYFSRS